MAKKLKSTDGFIFHGWMVTSLGLSGGELFAYALVHQFSQSEAGKYLGGPGYLSAWMGCSVNTARKYLHSILEKGLIINLDREENGVTFRDYIVNEELLNNFGTPSKILGTPLKNFGIENNIENNTSNEVYISINPKPQKFDFRRAVIGLGVKPSLVDEWLQVRKVKKGVNTETAFNDIVKEIALAGQNGHAPEECIHLAVVKSWCGFKWSWMQNEITPTTTKATRSTPGTERNTRSRNTMEDLLALGQEMFGGQFDEQ